MDERRLAALGKQLEVITGGGGGGNVLVVPTDVSQFDQVVALRNKVYEAWGEVSISEFCRVHVCGVPCLRVTFA